jgi:hypothetical protein
MGLVAVTAGPFAVGAYLGRNAAPRGVFWALIRLIVFGVVAIFVQIPNSALIYAILGLVIFAGLTAIDFQRLRRNQDIRTAPVARGLDLPRHPQRVPPVPVDLRRHRGLDGTPLLAPALGLAEGTPGLHRGCDRG